MCRFTWGRTTAAGLILALGLPLSAQQGPAVGVGGNFDHRGRRIDHPDYQLIVGLEDQEERGLQLYRSEKYQQAYEVLAETARHGLKSSQHAVARMHLEGQAVAKNVLVGTALLGLAAESGDRKIEREYNQLLLALPEEYRSLVGAQVEYYVDRYGARVQGVVCQRVKKPDSHRTTTSCAKQPGKYQEYPWEP